MNINIISSINDIKDDYYYYKEKIDIQYVENNIYNNQFNDEINDINKKTDKKTDKKKDKKKNKDKDIDKDIDIKKNTNYKVNKKNLQDKKFIELHNKSDIKYYEFYINDSKPIISTNIIKNHISYSIVKYTSFNILFRPFIKPTIETLNIFIFFENIVEHYFRNKIISNFFRDYKDFKFINNIHKNPEYSLSIKVKINETKLDIPIFNTSNNIIDYDNIKKDDSLKYLIELDSIYLDCSKKIYGINWKILQVLKEDDIYRQKCLLLSNHTNINHANTNHMNTNHTNTNHTNTKIKPNKMKIPNPPPLFLPISSVNIEDLQKMKNKITGKKLET